VVNRTAAFTFHIEDRYFGVVTAVRVFRQLAPALAPLVTRIARDEAATAYEEGPSARAPAG
jgi:hypothetical protein